MVMLLAVKEHEQCTPHASRACCHGAVVYHHVDADIAKLGAHARERLDFVHERTARPARDLHAIDMLHQIPFLLGQRLERPVFAEALADVDERVLVVADAARQNGCMLH
jgi:hypothetical protein